MHRSCWALAVMTDIRRILFVELLGGIGDILIALPAIHALARSHPAAQLTVLTFAPGDQLLLTDPLIDRVVTAHAQNARQKVNQLLAESLAEPLAEPFDLIVSDTTYHGIAEAIQDYKSAATNYPIVVTNLWRSPPDDEFVGDRFLKILLSEGVIAAHTVTQNQSQLHLTTTERAIARQTWGALYRPLIFLCPDAGMPIKRWPTTNFIELGQALQRQGATIVVVVGSDAKQAEQIVQGIGGTAQIWPRGSLRQLMGAIACADLMIAADTGIARIAAALDIPTLTLFGPSWHQRYGQPTPHINLQGFPDCPERLINNFTQQCCWYSGDCPYPWSTCVEDILPATVLAKAKVLLNRQVFNQNTNAPDPKHLFDRPSVWQDVRNLLVMRLDNIGDVIMTTPVLQALRENLPEAKITLMSSPSGAATAALLPWIDQVLPWRVLWQDLGRLDFNPSREWELVAMLKAHNFDGAIVLTSFSQSPHPAGLICALAEIPLRLGESKEQDQGTLTHAISPAPDTIHQVDRNLRLIESVGFQVRDRRLALYPSDQSQQSAARMLQRQLQDRAGSADIPYLLLNPWTTCPSRNYDPHRFAIAAQRLSQITGWSVVVTGIEKDRDRAQILLSILGERAIDLVGTTSLDELVVLVKTARLVLTNNTSTMHIADAMGTPMVVMFAGTEEESQWHPRYSSSRLLRRPTVCSPCYAFTCPYDLQCLAIDPERLIAAGLELLGIVDCVP
jgi:ADP-heptose:LPS heptosyltransferase